MSQPYGFPLCRLRERVAHYVPDALTLTAAVLKVILRYLWVHDTSGNALKLINGECLHTICLQLKHMLAGRLSGEALAYLLSCQPMLTLSLFLYHSEPWVMNAGLHALSSLVFKFH